MLGTLGFQEMAIILILALLLFGPNKLPELGRMLGKAITEFRRASNELKSTFESHLSELERENQSLKQTLNSYVNSDSSSSYSYEHSDYNHYDTDYHQYPESYDSAAPQEEIASATATQDATADREEDHLAVQPHVEGTIARSSNLPEEVHQSTAQESHPA